MCAGHLIPYEDKYWEQYQSFALKHWGKNCYQATRAYYEWLYFENPQSRQNNDFIVLMNKENLVGCMHKIRMPWRIGSEIIDVPALHNLMVAPEYRSGYGLLLITNSIKNEKHAFISGVDDPLSNAYRMLKSEEVPLDWYLVPLSIKNILFSKLKILFQNNNQKIFFKLTDRNIPGWSSSFAPEKKEIAKFTRLLNEKYSKKTAVIIWNDRLFSWRFFAKNGPKHIIIYDQNSFNFLIFALCLRKEFLICRLIETSIDNTPLMTTALKASFAILKKLGVNFVLTKTADKALVGGFSGLNIRPKNTHTTRTFVYHQDKKPFENSHTSFASGDYGFEGMNLKIIS